MKKLVGMPMMARMMGISRFHLHRLVREGQVRKPEYQLGEHYGWSEATAEKVAQAYTPRRRRR